jgi:acyl dehydratase
MESRANHTGLGWGLTAVAPPDPAAEARRAESLGFGHLAMPEATLASVLLALGATRSLKILVDDVEPFQHHLPPLFRKRLNARPPSWSVTPVQFDELDAPEGPYNRVHRWPSSEPLCGLVSECRQDLQDRIAHGLHESTFELWGAAHDRSWMVSRLALDVLPASRPAEQMIYAEDLKVGDVFELGQWCPSEDEIIAFAERWDPLDLHIDPQLARDTPLGALCASGIHSQAIMQRLSARGFTRHVAVIAGRAMLGMQLHQPVVPGMELTGRTEITDVHLRSSGRAVVTIRSTLRHAERPVLQLEGELVVEQRSHQNQHLVSA